MVVFFLCLLCVQSLLCPSVCAAVCFLWFNCDHLCDFWQSSHLRHCACVPWVSLPVMPSKQVTVHDKPFPWSCGSWVSITAQPLGPGLGSTTCCLQSCCRLPWECSLLGEYPEGTSRGKGPLGNPESRLVCLTWSRFVQGQMPCGRQSTALPTACRPCPRPTAPAVLPHDEACPRIQARLNCHCAAECWKQGSPTSSLLGTDSRGYLGRHQHSCPSRECASHTQSVYKHAVIQDSKGREKPPGMQSMSRRRQ